MLPDVAELLYPDRFDEKVTCAMCDASHDSGVLSIGGHHCGSRINV